MKPFRFIRRILGYLLKGQCSLALYTLSCELPGSLFRYNKAAMMHTESFRFPENRNPLIKVKVAGSSDVDDIVRVSEIDREKVLYLLQAGVVCFLASVGDAPASSVAWCARGRCFVRGLGFEYDFGDDSSYGFWAFTLPESRGKGLHYALMAEKARFELDRGVTRFYGIIEFDNEQSYQMRIRTGFTPLMVIWYLKFLFVRISVVRELKARALSFRVFLREPGDNVIII